MKSLAIPIPQIERLPDGRCACNPSIHGLCVLLAKPEIVDWIAFSIQLLAELPHASEHRRKGSQMLREIAPKH